jgi:AraC-like DNA-binding protein
VAIEFVQFERGGRPEGRRSATMPRPLVDKALTLPLTRHLLAVSAGSYDDAPGHVLERPFGIPDTVVSICVSGRGWLRIDGAVHQVGPGQAFVIPAGTPHEHGAHDPAWRLRWVNLGGSAVPEVLAALGSSLRRPIVRVPHPERAVAFVEEIRDGYARDPSLTRLVETSGVTWRLLSFLAVERLRPAPSDPLQLAMDHVADHVTERIDVVELARQVGLSPSRLHARFREATGGGIIAYLTGLRLARAAQLLDDPGMRVADVARAVGYDDPDYFSRRFQRTHGMSPTAFRARPRP